MPGRAASAKGGLGKGPPGEEGPPRRRGAVSSGWAGPAPPAPPAADPRLLEIVADQLALALHELVEVLTNVVVPDGLDGEVEVLDPLELLLGPVAPRLPVRAGRDQVGAPRVRARQVRPSQAGTARVRFCWVRGRGRHLGLERVGGGEVTELGLGRVRLEGPAERLGLGAHVRIVGGDVWFRVGHVVVRRCRPGIGGLPAAGSTVAVAGRLTRHRGGLVAVAGGLLRVPPGLVAVTGGLVAVTVAGSSP